MTKSKKKTEKYHILFKGRFKLDAEQVSNELAFKVVDKCNLKKKSLDKTVIKIHDNGFHIGHSSGLVKRRKLWFYYKDIKHFYVFQKYPNSVAIVNSVKEKYFISYFEFDKMIGFENLIGTIEAFKGGNKKIENPEDQIDAMEGYINQGISIESLDKCTDSKSPSPQFEIENNDTDTDDDTHIEEDGNDDIIGTGFTDIDIEKMNYLQQSQPPSGEEEEEQEPEENVDSKINNCFRSDYMDLFAELNEDFVFEEPKKRLAKIVGGSSYLFSQQFVAPALDIPMGCESDESDW